jgi:NAD(P)H-flavin reductase
MLNNFRTILSKKTQLNSTTYLYHFDLLEPKEITFKPGQYIILKVPSEKGSVSRLYSLASSNIEKNSFELIVETVVGGLGSGYLSSLKEGVEVNFQGPAGMYELRKNDRKKIFMVTGTGIAPIISILRSTIDDRKLRMEVEDGGLKLEKQTSKYYLFWGLKYYQDLYLLDELKQLAIINSQLIIKICLSREQNLDMIPEEDKKYFFLGHVDSCFEQLLTINDELLNNYEFYLCGGRNVVEALKQTLLSKNIPLESIVFEKF